MRETLPSKSVIFLHWKDWLDQNGLDWGEPSCWACEYGFNGKYDVNNHKASIEDICKAWNKSPLQRCHIIPKSLGGSNEPANLFLMCSECHDLAPNTTFPDLFMRWVSKQNYFVRRAKEVQELMETFDFKVTHEEAAEFHQTLVSKDYLKWFMENSGLHWNQRGLGNKVTTSTHVGLYCKYLEMKKGKNDT
ncbi:MAG: HNH endonuclease [Bacteroidota bacterium]